MEEGIILLLNLYLIMLLDFNEAPGGGGVYIGDLDTKPIFNNCTFEENKAKAVNMVEVVHVLNYLLNPHLTMLFGLQ